MVTTRNNPNLRYLGDTPDPESRERHTKQLQKNTICYYVLLSALSTETQLEYSLPKRSGKCRRQNCPCIHQRPPQIVFGRNEVFEGVRHGWQEEQRGIGGDQLPEQLPQRLLERLAEESADEMARRAFRKCWLKAQDRVRFADRRGMPVSDPECVAVS